MTNTFKNFMSEIEQQQLGDRIALTYWANKAKECGYKVQLESDHVKVGANGWLYILVIENDQPTIIDHATGNGIALPNDNGMTDHERITAMIEYLETL